MRQVGLLLVSHCCTVLVVYSDPFSSLLIDIPTPNIGNVYIADSENNRIRKVTVSTGIISTIAGTGTASYSGDGGAATSAGLVYPYGVALDASGRVIIITICFFIFLYFVNLLISILDYRQFIFPHPIGNVYIAESSSQRIRKITVSTSSSPRCFHVFNT